ncbi:ankyrin repeat-containing domain protein [Xylaria palmicola]|nr:ankyrin repeat-containing domain protein [Xylaria palmicola]
MADRSAEKILERRRVQNREAQRRFREKKTLQKTLDFLQLHDYPYRALDSLLHSPPSGDLALPLPSCQFPEPGTADITGPTRSWDPATPDPVVADDTGSFGYGNSPDDAAAQLPVFALQSFSTTTFSATDNSRGIPTPEPSAKASVECPSGMETSLSPQNSAPESLHDGPPSPTLVSPMKDAGGWLSPLHIAAKKGSSRIIRMLLQHNIDCNEPDSEGLTPLMHAVIGGHEEATRSLLECGARMENVDQDGGKRPCLSAIHWAVLKRREGVLRVLLDHSSDPKLIDNYDHLGRAPLHIAIDNEFHVGVGLLLQFGADPSRKAQQRQSDL